MLKHFTQQFPGVSVRTDVLSKAEIACKEGLVCRRETIDGHVCRQETQTGELLPTASIIPLFIYQGLFFQPF